MAEITAVEEPRRRRFRIRGDWRRRLAIEFAAFVLAIMALAAIGLVLLDTAPGHRFIADRIGQIETASGLRFRVGRIEGSIFGETRLKSVEVLDQRGVFLTSPEIDVDWSPGAWLYNALHFDRISAERVTLLRKPQLKPTGRRGPILPKFDIYIGELSIQRLELAPAIHEVDQPAGHHDGSKHGSDDPHRQGHGKAFHRPTADGEQNDGDEERGDVGIENRDQSAIEPC